MNNYVDTIQIKLGKWLEKIVKEIAEEKSVSINSVKASLENIENIIHRFASNDEFNEWVKKCELENKSCMEENNFRRIVWREYLGVKNNIIVDIDINLFSSLKSEEEKKAFSSLKAKAFAYKIDLDNNKIKFMIYEWDEEIFREKLNEINRKYQQGKIRLKYNHRISVSKEGMRHM